MTYLIPRQARALLQREPTAPFIDARGGTVSWRVGHPRALSAGLAREHL